jgi:hypothetical protein
MAKFIPVRGAYYQYHKHVNFTPVKGLNVSTVQFTNGAYETVIFNDSGRRLAKLEYYGEGIKVPGSAVMVGYQYNHYTKKEANRAHREFVSLINRYA